MTMDPPQPHLSMKGRTPRALLRQSNEWLERSKLPKKIASLTWKASGIEGFCLVEPDGNEARRCWTIRELTTSAEVRREGEAMRHCVASYIGTCARRETSIWSMRFENHERRHRVMTIEVDLATRTICQARRRGNALPNLKIIDLMRRWAEQAGLEIDL